MRLNMTDKNIKLKIVTQNKIVYEGEVDAFIQIP